MALPARMAGIERWAKGKGFGEVAASLEGKPKIDDPKALAAWIKKRAGGKGAFVRRLKGGK